MRRDQDDQSTDTFRSEAGFSLAEVIVASALLVTTLVALAELLAAAARSNTSSLHTAFSTVLAQQKLEQLRTLAWEVDSVGSSISDLTTDTTLPPDRPPSTGGTGLTPSPGNSLVANLSGYVDYLDAMGRSLGTGDFPQPGTAYIRRWSIEPLPAVPDDGLVLQVRVSHHSIRGSPKQGASFRLAEEAHVVTLKARKAP
jgi:hypothetical protein